MLLITGLDSMIESLYLDEDISESIKASNIIVNPDDGLYKYLSGKLVIINHMHYPEAHIRYMKDKNKVITRVNFSIRGVSFRPYELRCNDRIRRSNESIDFIDESCYLTVDHRFDGINLYYPSPDLYKDHMHRGSLTSLGYLLYQIGYDFIEDTPFKNLDVIKLKNGLII